ncbi:hypothetical protein IIK97_004085 [Salmonella enterica subsp. enterica serovar Nigeria]|nr:hypothetical protein [Salmonella enterica subsp. enterica serovar Nigeria]
MFNENDKQAMIAATASLLVKSHESLQSSTKDLHTARAITMRLAKADQELQGLGVKDALRSHVIEHCQKALLSGMSHNLVMSTLDHQISYIRDAKSRRGNK